MIKLFWGGKMRILAIDPGNMKSAYVIYEQKIIVDFGIKENEKLLEMLEQGVSAIPTCKHLAIEMPACYGMAVGKTIFDTCRWVGRFQQAFNGGATSLVYRKAPNEKEGIDSVVMHLCKNPRANDANVRQAIIDLYPATGGGKIPQIGTKKQRGPLYGVRNDVWAALAVAICFEGRMKRKSHKK